MKCYKCGKDIDRKEGKGEVIKGIEVIVKNENIRTEKDIEYYNKQLGKYSDGYGACNIAICYECYIDILFHMEKNNDITMP